MSIRDFGQRKQSLKGLATARLMSVVIANLMALPILKILPDWSIDPDAAYLHFTPNETIAGLEFDYVPEVDMPVVADMPSSILSRPIDVSKFGVIYAGAQKNMGISGLTIVIVREDLLGQALSNQPILFDYSIQAQNNSMFNTPCTFAWYVASPYF